MSLPVSPAQIVELSESPLLAAPEEWDRRPLGEVAAVINGFAFKSEGFVAEGGTPLIRIRDIFNDRTEVGYVGAYDHRYVVQRGDLLIGMDGDFNCRRWGGPEALLNQRVCKVVPDPQKLNVDFLTHLLPAYLRAIHDATSSTTVTHLSSRDVAQIPVPIPPLPEQDRLAEAFAAASAKQTSTKRHLDAARRAILRFREAVLSSASSGRLTTDWRDKHMSETGAELRLRLATSRGLNGDRCVEPTLNRHAIPQDLPESWTLVALGLLLRDLKYGTAKRSEHQASGTPVIRIPNVSGNGFDISDLKFASLDKKELAALALQPGDLLMIRSNGSVSLVGKTVAVPDAAVGMAYAGYLLRLRIDPNVEPRYVESVLASRALRRQIELPARSTSGVHNINSGEVRALAIPLPPRAEQTEIVRRVGRLNLIADALERRIAAASGYADRVSDAVLVKALRGELAGFA